MRISNRVFALPAAVAVSFVLTACGGGGGESASPAATASPTAVDTSTIDSFLAYQKSQPAASTIDPATLQSQLAPVSETAQPTPII